MRRAVVVLAVLLCYSSSSLTRPAVAAPTTQPTTRPATVAEAQAAVNAAKTLALAKLVASSEYKQKKAVADAAMAKLQQARETGTPEDRLAASHDYVVANAPVKAMEETAFKSDPDVAAAEAELQRVRTAAAEAVKRIQEAKRPPPPPAPNNDPMDEAMRKGKIVLGMTEDQAERAYHNRWASNQVEGEDLERRRENHFTKGLDELGDGVRSITYKRSAVYASGEVFVGDQVTVRFRDGKAIQIFGQ